MDLTRSGLDRSTAGLMGSAYLERLHRLEEATAAHTALSTAEQEIILVAINAAITLFDAAAVRHHATRAAAAGATMSEIAGAFLIGGLGSHTITECVPILAQELAAAGIPLTDGERDLAAEERHRDRIRSLRGFYGTDWDAMVQLDPAWTLSYHELTGLATALSARMTELVIIAADACTTHLNLDGVRVHIRKALQVGATRDDILHVLELTTLVGYRTVFMGTAMLADALGHPRSGDGAASPTHCDPLT